MIEADVILERSLTLHDAEAELQIIVRIHRPETDPLSGGDWRCVFSIEGIPGRTTFTRTSYGVDPMQAAILALQHLRLELRHLVADGLDIRWLGMTDLRFPNLVETEPSVEEWRRIRRG